MNAKELANHMEVHLVAWQHIAQRCAEMGLRLYKCRPKHHYCEHIFRDVRVNRLNPRKSSSCHNDESFLGYIKRIGIRCHQTSMLSRIYQRYLLHISLRWRDASELWPPRKNREPGIMPRSAANEAQGVFIVVFFLPWLIFLTSFRHSIYKDYVERYCQNSSGQHIHTYTHLSLIWLSRKSIIWSWPWGTSNVYINLVKLVCV